MRSNAAPERKNVLFKNWTTEDFTHTWGGQPIRIPAGQTLMMNEGIALMFASTLADREINKADAWVKFNSYKLPAYQALVKKAVSEVSTEEIANVINDGEADVNEIMRLNANRKTEAQLRKEQAEVNKPNLIEDPQDGFGEPAKPRFCQHCDSKGVRHKRVCPTLTKPESVVSSEFSDLSTNASFA